jgi:hypothetical protein
MRLNSFLALADDLLKLLERDEDLWFEIWEAEKERRIINKAIKEKVTQIENFKR